MEYKTISPDNAEKWVKLIDTITRAALRESGIPQVDGTDFRAAKDKPWEVAYKANEYRKTLLIASNMSIVAFTVEIPMLKIVTFYFMTVESLLNQEKIRVALNLRQEGFETIVKEISVNLIVHFIYMLPEVLFNSSHQAVHNTFIDLIKKVIEPELRRMKEDGEESLTTTLIKDKLSDLDDTLDLGNFSIFKYLESVDSRAAKLKRRVLKDKKVFLNTSSDSTVSEEYKTLLSEYQEARKTYRKKRKAYFEIYPKRKTKEWQLEWFKISCDQYPDLYLTDRLSSDLIHGGQTPSELAYEDLARGYDYSVDYIMKLVKADKRRKKKKE